MQLHSNGIPGKQYYYRRRRSEEHHQAFQLFFALLSLLSFLNFSNAFVSRRECRGFGTRHIHFAGCADKSCCSPSRDSLESMTVKELRQMVKESSSAERGLLSRLKRKKDLVDYLQENLGNKDSNTSNEDPKKIKLITREPRNGMSIRSTKMPMRMPAFTDFDNQFSQVSKEESSAHPSSTLQQEEEQLQQPQQQQNQEQKPPQSPRDALFEQLYQRYPPLREKEELLREKEELMAASRESGENDEADEEEDGEIIRDFRQIYHPIFTNNNVTTDMDVIFVGTASCTPSVTRGVSCTALRLNWKKRAAFSQSKGPPSQHKAESNFKGGTWMFDVGECTQLQVQRTGSVKPSKINKIFLTHAHGDHTFGLPGLLCLMGQDREGRDESEPVEIYGPEGLRMWLRVAIRYSVSRIIPPYRVHEIMDIPMSPDWKYNKRIGRYFHYRKGRGNQFGNVDREWRPQGLAGEDPDSWITRSSMISLERSQDYSEVEGGRDIFPIYDHPLCSDGAPVWEIEDEEDVKVYAAPMSHGIPCVGYVVEEQSRPGRLRNEFVEPIVKRNVNALRDAGFKVPMKAMAVIKNLPVGSAFTFPDGTVVTQSEAVEPPRKGRKVVICGDSADCSAIAGLARGADVLIHEATNAYLHGIDKDTNLKSVTRDAIVHGHSTPQIAGKFAREIGAKQLLLNHFSARYKGDKSIESLSLMTRIEEQAIKASNLDETTVAAAWDLMILPIRSP